MSEVKDAPATSSVLRPSMLRPSKFASNSSENLAGEAGLNFDKEKDKKISNPFFKECQLDDDKNDNESNSTAGSEKTNEKASTDPLSLLSKPNFSQPKLFANVNANQESGFVFGQNLHERVVGDNIKAQNEEGSSSGHNSSSETCSFFTTAAKNSTNNENGKEKSGETKSLSEVAREYEESRAQKRKYEKVKVVTGEENENNVAEIDCKLFAFKNGNYEEISRGILRLNDSREKSDAHRVVFRTFGTLKLMVNTKVWSDMIVEIPSPKSLRFTAMDNDGHIKIFLVMSRPDYITSFYNALKNRVTKLKTLKNDSNDEEGERDESKDDIENQVDNNEDKEIKISTLIEKTNRDENSNDEESEDDCSEPTNKKINVDDN